jgi:phosphate uptake regulator
VQSKEIILKSHIEIDHLSESILTRELIAQYISGVDEISIKSQKFSLNKKNHIQSICNRLLGFETFNETPEEILIKNILDQTKFPLSQKIEKMFTITKSMCEDAYRALRNQDLILAKDVENRDFEIDKLNIAIARQLYVNVRKDLSSSDLKVDDIDLIYFQNISTQLERIADHAVKIARTSSSKDISGTPIMLAESIVTNIAALLEETKKIVYKLDKNMAHRIWEDAIRIENQIYNKKTKKHKDSFAWDVLEDSLDRIRGYILNMAEITIDQAVLKKQLHTNIE